MKKFIVSSLAFVGFVSLCTDFQGCIDRCIKFYANRIRIVDNLGIKKTEMPSKYLRA